MLGKVLWPRQRVYVTEMLCALFVCSERPRRGARGTCRR